MWSLVKKSSYKIGCGVRVIVPIFYPAAIITFFWVSYNKPLFSWLFLNLWIQMHLSYVANLRKLWKITFYVTFIFTVSSFHLSLHQSQILAFQRFPFSSPSQQNVLLCCVSFSKISKYTTTNLGGEVRVKGSICIVFLVNYLNV